MSSLGQMVAGMAHEINNPINFVHGNIKYAREYVNNLLELVELYRTTYPDPTPEILQKCEDIEFDFLTEDLLKLLDSMTKGSERIRKIILSLRNFSRLDEAEIKLVDIHEGLDSTLLILKHRLKPIQVKRKYGALPLVECYAGQLNQVFLNIVSNAIDALESRANENRSENDEIAAPRITIATEYLVPHRVAIAIADNGPGMSEVVARRMFDPFFTTKPIGKGTGLGLSISYQIIVEKHGGRFDCRTTPGEGTTLRIELPLSLSGRTENQ